MQDNDDEIEFDSPLEEEIEVSDAQHGRNKIFTKQGDLEIDSLHRKYQNGKLDVQPDFQRQFVWDAKKSSRLIESALLNIPLPVVYISQGKDGKEYVIDGQQRLTSFFRFIDGKFSLSGLTAFDEYNGKYFNGIKEEDQDKVRGCTIRTITFLKESDENLKFEIFKRLNTGSVPLNDQELRNCIYRGPYNQLLRRLAENNEFKSLMGFTKPDKRMRDVELVLRFSAFFHQTYRHYKRPMKSFLNTEMEKNQAISDSDAKSLEEAFKNALHIVKSLLEEKAFKRYYKGTSNNPNGHWALKQRNKALYDTLMVSFAKADKHATVKNLDAIREALIYLMIADQDFIDSIEAATDSPSAVKERFGKWRLTLEDIIGIQHKEPRCFSKELKQQMLRDNPICAICGQRIRTLDDAALDHIKQYWRGGKTIPANARLVHRYCSWSRSLND